MNKYQAALRESELQKQAVLDCSEDAILLFDRNLRVLWANNNVDRLCSNPVGRRCGELFCGTTSKCRRCQIIISFKKGKDPVRRQIVVAGANGTGQFFSITCALVPGGVDGAEKLVVVAHDITERLQLEKQLRHASKMEAIGTLAGGIAHDFNNILTPIMGYAEIMRLNFLNNHLDRSESISYIDQVLYAAKRAHKLIEQILVFSRNTEMNESLQPVHPIIKEGLKLIHATIPSSIEIRQDIDEECGMVTVDSVEIHQILISLCKNAADAMAHQGGILTITLRKSAESDGRGDWLELSVTDNGRGIAPEHMDKIFDPYFTTKEKVQGTGMGLAMAHGIIKRQGGRISVDSVVGHGTTITLHLPVIKEQIDFEEAVSHSTCRGGNEHILLVDDEQQVVDATAEVLVKLGYRVTKFTSAPEAALEFLNNRNRFDLVITDLTMPYMTGIDLCEKIKEVRRDIPVLLFSGFLEDFSRSRAMEAGVDGFCLKPVSLGKMAKHIVQVLGK